MSRWNIALIGFGVLGAGVLTYAAFKAKDEADLQRFRDDLAEKLRKAPPFVPAPSLPAPAPAPPPSGPGPSPTPRGPSQLGGTLVAQPGLLYRAVVNVNGPLSWVANASKVQREAESQGFPDAQVSTSKPGGWPGGASGDYYITGTYQGPPGKTFDRSAAGGSVKVIDVWEG